MKIVGYNRTSTKEQNLDRGNIKIKKFCETQGYDLKKIYSDKCTGKNFNRPRYIVMKEDVLDTGDILIISELDRLGRNKKETIQELNFFKDKGVRVMILDIPTTLTNFEASDPLANTILDTINNVLIEVYTLIAQAEIERKKEQQLKGIEAMKLRGDWEQYGRPRILNFETFSKAFRRVERGDVKPFELAKELGLNISTFYRYRKEYYAKKEQKEIDKKVVF